MFLSFGHKLRGLGNVRVGFRMKGSTGCFLVCLYGFINLLIYLMWYTMLGTFWLLYGMCYLFFYLPIKWIIKYNKKNNNPKSSPTFNSSRPSNPTPTPTTPSPSPSPTVDASAKKTENHHVAGENYHLEEILDLMGENPYYSYGKSELINNGYVDERVYKLNVYTGAAELVPEPENPHDPKAIKVIVEGNHIGYIKAGSCAHIHKLLLEDSIEKVEVEIKGGDYKIVYEDYDDDTEKSTYTLERDSMSIRAVVTLTLK